MPLGQSELFGVAFYTGSPASASTAVFDVPKGTIVLDTTNGVAYLKILGIGTNTAGYDQMTMNAAVQTLTNKTFTTPTINGGTITGATLVNPVSTGTGTSETKFCTTQFDAVTGTTGTTLTNVVGLTGFTLTAAGVYKFEGNISGVSTASSGLKIGFGLTTATMTNFEAVGMGFEAAAVAVQHTTTATTGMTIFGATAAYIAARISGRITVNAAGTLALQAAQNAAHADTTSVYVGSWLTLSRIS